MLMVKLLLQLKCDRFCQVAVYKRTSGSMATADSLLWTLEITLIKSHSLARRELEQWRDVPFALKDKQS